MITYNDLYEALRKERYSEQLQPIAKKFVQEVSSYMDEKKKLVNREDDFFSDEVAKIKKQLENANSIFKELILLRKKKLLGLVFVASETGINKRDFENMLDFEKDLFDKVLSYMEYTEKTLSTKFSNKRLVTNDKNMKLVLFLDGVDEFLNTDGKTMGPYKKNDIVNLPIKIAEILVNDKKAEVILED